VLPTTMSNGGRDLPHRIFVYEHDNGGGGAIDVGGGHVSGDRHNSVPKSGSAYVTAEHSLLRIKRRMNLIIL